MVEYTGVYNVNKNAATQTAQIDQGGVRQVGDTQRRCCESGRPPSRAKAKAIRDADVTVASPHKYCAITMPTNNADVTAEGTTERNV
jgi:hypothetical protein